MLQGKLMCCCCCWSQPDSGLNRTTALTHPKQTRNRQKWPVWKTSLSTAGWQGQTSPWRNQRNSPVPRGHPTWECLRSHHAVQGTPQGLKRIWIYHNFLLPAVETSGTAQCPIHSLHGSELWASRNWCWAVGTQALGGSQLLWPFLVSATYSYKYHYGKKITISIYSFSLPPVIKTTQPQLMDIKMCLSCWLQLKAKQPLPFPSPEEWANLRECSQAENTAQNRHLCHRNCVWGEKKTSHGGQRCGMAREERWQCPCQSRHIPTCPTCAVTHNSSNRYAGCWTRREKNYRAIKETTNVIQRVKVSLWESLTR